MTRSETKRAKHKELNGERERERERERKGIYLMYSWYIIAVIIITTRVDLWKC